MTFRRAEPDSNWHVEKSLIKPTDRATSGGNGLWNLHLSDQKRASCSFDAGISTGRGEVGSVTVSCPWRSSVITVSFGALCRLPCCYPVSRNGCMARMLVYDSSTIVRYHPSRRHKFLLATQPSGNTQIECEDTVARKTRFVVTLIKLDRQSDQVGGADRTVVNSFGRDTTLLAV